MSNISGEQNLNMSKNDSLKGKDFVGGEAHVFDDEVVKRNCLQSLAVASVFNTGRDIGEDGRIRQKTDALSFSREFRGDGHSQGGVQIGSFDKIKRKVESMHASNDTNEITIRLT